VSVASGQLHYTPELQPAERLWPLLNAALANRDHADLPALEDAVTKGATHYHWWPET